MDEVSETRPGRFPRSWLIVPVVVLAVFLADRLLGAPKDTTMGQHLWKDIVIAGLLIMAGFGRSLLSGERRTPVPKTILIIALAALLPFVMTGTLWGRGSDAMMWLILCLCASLLPIGLWRRRLNRRG